VAQAELSVSQMPSSIVTDDVVTLDEFCERPESPMSWVVPGLIDVEDRIIIVAPEGVGKSMVARWLAVSAGQGIHPFTGDPIDAPNTLLVDLENPGRIVRSKVRPMLSLMRARRGDGYSDSRTWIWHRPGGVNLRTRAGFAELDAVCRKVRPRLVCLGPLYKAYRGDPKRSEHDNASDVAAVFDDLRTRHGFALVLEHHAPLQQGAFRDLRPFGSLLWSQWPEVGIKLIPDADDPKGHTLIVDFYRGLRDERPWPAKLTRGTSAPWVASYADDRWRNTA
jgi:replicative DNA helicase